MVHILLLKQEKISRKEARKLVRSTIVNAKKRIKAIRNYTYVYPKYDIDIIKYEGE